MEIFWKACPTLKDELFHSVNNGYYSLMPKKEDINDVIDNDMPDMYNEGV